MTTWVPELDGSAALLDEWHAHLHGDPRYTEPDVPAPRYVAQLRATTETIHRRAALDAQAEDQP